MKSKFFLFVAVLVITATASAQSTVDSITAKYKMVPMPGALTIEKTFPVLGVYQLGGTDASMTAGMNSGMNNGTTTNGTNGTTNTNSNVNGNNTSTASTGNTSATTSDVTSTTGSTSAVAANTVVITLDSANKGMVWVEGLPQGKFKAYLKKSPATYRILAQKTETGKQVPEGTLLFDPATNQLNIAFGKDFDDADPAGIFALNTAATATTSPNEDNTVKVKVKTPTSKTKSKVTFYTATKVDAAGATQGATGTFDTQLQQSQTQQGTQGTQGSQGSQGSQGTQPSPAPAPQTTP
jgi:hypothetical protein